MSYTTQEWAYNLGLENGTQSAVLVCLAWHRNQGDGKCCPSIARLVFCTGFKSRAVQKAIIGLIDAGLITRNQKPGKIPHYYFDETIEGRTTTNPRTKCTPALDAPPHLTTQTPASNDVTPALDAPVTRKITRKEQDSVFVKCFKEFYEAYPSPQSRPSAKQAYQRALKKASHEKIMEGVRAYAASVKHLKDDELRYIPAPAKWLDQEKWNDQASTIDKPREIKNPLPYTEKFLRSFNVAAWNTWFGPCNFIENDDELIVEAPTQNHIDQIKRGFYLDGLPSGKPLTLRVAA